MAEVPGDATPSGPEAGTGLPPAATADVPTPTPVLPAPAAATSPSPAALGPTIDMPAAPSETERAPATGRAPGAAGGSFALPRETPIETPLGLGPVLSGTAIGGYGELTFVKPSNGVAVVDMRRLVVYVGHNFTDKLRFYSEIEIEHAISSADDRGEVEVEQAYLDGLLGRRFNLRGGVIIMPVGIINVYHEPPTFNGVDRPDVDSVIIPSTWREAGIGMFGELTEGLRYQLYLVNGFQASGLLGRGGSARRTPGSPARARSRLRRRRSPRLPAGAGDRHRRLRVLRRRRDGPSKGVAWARCRSAWSRPTSGPP